MNLIRLHETIRRIFSDQTEEESSLHPLCKVHRLIIRAIVVCLILLVLYTLRSCLYCCYLHLCSLAALLLRLCINSFFAVNLHTHEPFTDIFKASLYRTIVRQLTHFYPSTNAQYIRSLSAIHPFLSFSISRSASSLPLCRLARSAFAAAMLQLVLRTSRAFVDISCNRIICTAYRAVVYIARAISRATYLRAKSLVLCHIPFRRRASPIRTRCIYRLESTVCNTAYTPLFLSLTCVRGFGIRGLKADAARALAYNVCGDLQRDV